MLLFSYMAIFLKSCSKIFFPRFTIVPKLQKIYVFTPENI